MLNLRAMGSQVLFGTAMLAALACLPARAADPEITRLEGSDRIYLAQAKMQMSQDDALTKAMELLHPTGGGTPSRSDVDSAGHMLMEAGPDAFEKAMNLLSRPGVTSTQIASAKAQMMKGGPDASAQAMSLLRKSYGY